MCCNRLRVQVQVPLAYPRGMGHRCRGDTAVSAQSGSRTQSEGDGAIGTARRYPAELSAGPVLPSHELNWRRFAIAETQSPLQGCVVVERMSYPGRPPPIVPSQHSRRRAGVACYSSQCEARAARARDGILVEQLTPVGSLPRRITDAKNEREPCFQEARPKRRSRVCLNRWAETCHEPESLKPSLPGSSSTLQEPDARRHRHQIHARHRHERHTIASSDLSSG